MNLRGNMPRETLTANALGLSPPEFTRFKAAGNHPYLCDCRCCVEFWSGMSAADRTDWRNAVAKSHIPRSSSQ